MAAIVLGESCVYSAKIVSPALLNYRLGSIFGMTLNAFSV